MIFGSTAEVLAECKLTYYRISEGARPPFGSGILSLQFFLASLKAAALFILFC